jgi:hypothetical protein
MYVFPNSLLHQSGVRLDFSMAQEEVVFLIMQMLGKRVAKAILLVEQWRRGVNT